uniref:Uncharacterized protein n=1 Tax=Attheya septentrionalis TaxID=420275 RepID=A0A6T7HAI0_9STRA|mmetsp:Transcript_20076/g.36437  ORF Transcript_20076/g.36437 Transcript_20076/m.36437 type:complete len:343 (+) Transcript_20076:110-1138(+)
MSSEEDRTLFDLIFSSPYRKWERVREFLLPFLLLSSSDEDEEEKKREIKRNIAYKGTCGLTILHFLVMKHPPLDVIQMMIDVGGVYIVTEESDGGKTPLQLAQEYKCDEEMTKLLQNAYKEATGNEFEFIQENSKSKFAFKYSPCIATFLKFLFFFPVPMIGFTLIMLSIGNRRDIKERDFYSDFEKIEGGCMILNSTFERSHQECTQIDSPNGGGGTTCRCTDYYLFSFSALMEDTSTAYTSLEVPHDGDRKYCSNNGNRDPVPPKWNEGEIVECYEPNFDYVPSQYSCGNPKCIRIFWDLSAIRLANTFLITGACLIGIGILSCLWIVLLSRFFKSRTHN